MPTTAVNDDNTGIRLIMMMNTIIGMFMPLFWMITTRDNNADTSKDCHSINYSRTRKSSTKRSAFKDAKNTNPIPSKLQMFQKQAASTCNSGTQVE